MRDGRHDADYAQAAAIAASVLAGSSSPLLASRELRGLLQPLGLDDPDYRVFVAIESETDALPIGPERRHWARQALAELAPEIERAERWAMDCGEEAFRNVVARFGRPN